jgi:hypothetical protein
MHVYLFQRLTTMKKEVQNPRMQDEFAWKFDFTPRASAHRERERERDLIGWKNGRLQKLDIKCRNNNIGQGFPQSSFS